MQSEAEAKVWIAEHTLPLGRENGASEGLQQYAMAFAHMHFFFQIRLSCIS